MLNSRSKPIATRARFLAGKLHAQVVIPRRLDRTPAEAGFPGSVLDGDLATVPPRAVDKTLAHFVRRSHQLDRNRDANIRLASSHLCSLDSPMRPPENPLILLHIRPQVFYGA